MDEISLRVNYTPEYAWSTRNLEKIVKTYLREGLIN